MNDKRLIEDYLPIVAISAEASREKSVRKGHISTLHLWWARRPLVACRAAVYGALVPASQFVPDGASDEKKKSLGRANAAKFVERLCQYPGHPAVIAEAQRHILEAHAERLTHELQQAGGMISLSARRTGGEGRGEVGPSSPPAWVKEFKWPADKTTVTVEDIVSGKAPRPKVLDMFAGGGAIPLEALRLGCEAYALDINPVAHIIQLCTLVYPQKYGKPDPTARGMTGPKNAKGETTWGRLADEVRYWGEWVLNKVKAEIGDLYPLIPDPAFKGKRQEVQDDLPAVASAKEGVPPGYLMPVAYLWTRTVTCKNPNCKATVPLLRQTWLCKKTGRFVALKMIAPRGKKKVHFEVVEARSEIGLGFDPEAHSGRGNATCPFCSTVADSDYVKAEGCAGRMARQLTSIACVRPSSAGKVYLSSPEMADELASDEGLDWRITELLEASGLTIPDEPIENRMTGGSSHPYGLTKFSDLFTPRQMLCLLTFADAVRRTNTVMQEADQTERCKAVATYLAVLLDRLADFNSSLCLFNYTGGRGVKSTFARQAIPMISDFAETNPFNPDAASWVSGMEDVPSTFEALQLEAYANVSRGSATALPWPDTSMDAVITDPPYYDNVDYAKISDFFYVWLKRSVGNLYPEHFAAAATPKKNEAVADPVRHGGSRAKATQAYESMMAKAFCEAGRVLNDTGKMVVVYAHKTTLGWSTLVDGLRTAGFTITEAWPMDTEKPGRVISQDTAALASSIFLVARKREGTETGNFEEVVKPELEQIVRERVETLWAMGISGADLVIACVGAGLRAFTRFARVEYANGEEVPAERFLTEVETVVLETILARLSKEVGRSSREKAQKAQKENPFYASSAPSGGHSDSVSLAGLDAPSRFYVLWRYTYGAADLDAGEAIIFANGTHVELDGHNGLAGGSNAVLEKNKSKYRLLDFTARGDEPKLGLPSDSGESAPMVDALHRLLWLLENKPLNIPEFLAGAQPNLEQLKLVCQALGGPALKGGELADISVGAEQSALGKLLANWSAVMEGQQVKADRQKGQDRLL